MAPAERPPLQGRDAELAALLAAATAALSERKPGVAAVLGEGGMGKSRLALELTDRLGARVGRRSWFCTPASRWAPTPTSPWPICCGGRWAWPTARPVPAPCCSSVWVGQAQPRWRRRLLLGWMPPEHPGRPVAARGPRRAAGQRGPRRQLALQRLAEQRPVVVLLDDAHWADDALLDALEQATVSELPLWICAFGRPAFAGSRPSWGQRAPPRPTRSQLARWIAERRGALCRHLLAPGRPCPSR